MKLCPGCHNPFASSKLYILFAVFFAFGWWLIWYSWNPICRDVAFEFVCSPEVICGNTGKDVLFLQNKRKPAATRKPNQKITQTNNRTRKPNHKYTNKQNNQNLGKQTQPSCVNNGSMYNMVKSMNRGFRLLKKVAHCTIINLLPSDASLQLSAPWLRVCLWCNLWTVELCQVCHHESVPGVAR